MPKGTVHAKATVALAAAGAFVTYRFGHPLPQILALSGGTLAGLLLTPDLDIDEGCISNDIVRHSAGRRVEQLWALFWRPYGLMLPHRSKLSHLPLLGTALRLVYIAILPALIWWFTTFSARTGMLPHLSVPIWVWWAFGGLVLADTLHYLMDELF
jgi:uncharacterized metal-binding protein